MTFDPTEKLILALDGMDSLEAIALVSRLPRLKWVKVGLELFITAGPETLAELSKLGVRIFLDLKFHDIPATMAKSCYKAANLGVDLMTVHACAGLDALAKSQLAVTQGVAESGGKIPTLLAVTVLTSWDQQHFSKELLIEQTLQSRVDMLAGLAHEAGIGGCVCSPLEVKNLRQRFPEPFELVTPGIRLNGFDLDDQVRVMTPSEAISLGASRIVIGRPITTSEDPLGTFEKYCQDIAGN